MRRRCSMVAVVVSVLMLATTSAWSVEGPRAKKTSYTVVSRTGGLVNVAALEWVPQRAKTVFLALHGRAGVKENNWGPLSVPNYSFALHRFAEGRAVVAIDFPGYGESQGDPSLAGIDDYAFVVAQIADALRTRFQHVVGVGHSMGAIVVGITQGMFASFDAIVPAALSHGGFSPEFTATCGQTPPACPNPRKLLFTSYADRRVVEAFVEPLRVPDSLARDQTSALSRREVTERVTSPVLIILGKDDYVFDRSKYAEEPSYYASSPDVKLVVLPRTGHAVFHHLNHGYVDSVIANWLTKHKL
jgi:pimeloyl-ACP methyl ester carboxylesterase